MDYDFNSLIGDSNIDNYYKYITFKPMLILIVIVIIILYFFIFRPFTSSSYLDDSFYGNFSLSNIIGKLFSSIFILLLLIIGLVYIINKELFKQILENIKKFFTGTSEEVDNSNIIKKEVYHIPGNNYTYDNAKAVCKALGNRLADYKEIEKSYKDGADWCSYGWSENQHALFPTQQRKWERLQKIEGHEHDCGRPGINGGFIDNPNIKFGVNCYGYKPKIKTQEAELMKNTSEFPLTKNEQEFDEKVDFLKTKVDEILLAPFNSNSWSKY